MSVSNKTAKKIGLIAAISVFVSSLIGIGIFFKNNTVFANNANNPYGILISWILASIISFATAFSFAEAGFNHRNGAGLGGTAERMYGSKFGRFISANYTFFYWGILNLALAIFSAESLVKMFYPNVNSIPLEFHMGYVMLIALGLMFIFLTFNYLSLKWSARFQVVSTVLKFLPLIIIGFTGIIYGSINFDNSLFNPNITNDIGINIANTKKQIGPISADGILSSIPAILFAYDSFTGVASLKGELKNAKRNVPLTIILGMVLSIIVYLLVTIGQMMVGEGIAQDVFKPIFQDNQQAQNIFTIIISFIIFICVIGTLNALTLVALRVFTYSIRYRIIFGYWFFNKHISEDNKPGYYLGLIIYLIWWTVLLIPSVILNSDVLVDGSSNFPTLFMFAVYGTIVLKAWINRFTKKIHVDKMPAFLYIAPIAVLGCYLAFGYQFFYYYSLRIIIDITTNGGQLADYNWGLFVGNSGIKPIYAAITFFVMFTIFIVFPFINDSLIKFKYKINKYDNLLLNELLV